MTDSALPRPCDECDGDDVSATHHCPHAKCDLYLCAKCASNHHSKKYRRDHKVAPLDFDCRSKMNLDDDASATAMGHRGQRSIAVSRVPSSPDMQANSFRVNMPGTRSSRLVSEDDILNDNLDCMYETEDRLEQQPGCGGDRGGGMYAPHKRMRTQMVPTQQHTHACGYRH